MLIFIRIAKEIGITEFGATMAALVAFAHEVFGTVSIYVYGPATSLSWTLYRNCLVNHINSRLSLTFAHSLLPQLSLDSPHTQTSLGSWLHSSNDLQGVQKGPLLALVLDKLGK